MISDALKRLAHGERLDARTMSNAMREVLEGRADPLQVAAWLMGLAARGETLEELAAAAQTLRDVATPLALGDIDVRVDTCGTGGDGAHTINISTLTAIALAACGVNVVKHGNRSVSSRCGSADLLEALDVNIEPSDAQQHEALEQAHIIFLFAPRYHQAMRNVAPIRKSLGVRTLFNLIGPLANPAHATHQLMGVYDPGKLELMAQVLARLGSRGAWVVHGEGGVDEISIAGETQVVVLNEGKLEKRIVVPEDFGIAQHPMTSLRGGDAEHNAQLAREVLSAKPSAILDAVILNTAAAWMVAEPSRDMKQSAAQVREAFESGAVLKNFERWKQLTRQLPSP